MPSREEAPCCRRPESVVSDFFQEINHPDDFNEVVRFVNNSKA
jgi:hypothetical protein